MTKTKFFVWLRTTEPPRKILHGRWYVWCCVLGGPTQKKILLEPNSQESADRHAAKFERWLREFEESEAADKDE